jgi:hypothetical protein
MTVHSTAFQAEQPARPIPAAAAVLAPDPIAFVATAAPAAARKLNFRKLLSTGAALAVLAGVAWVGKAVKHQALVMGFSDTFAVIGAVLVLSAMAVMLTRKVRGAAAGAH